MFPTEQTRERQRAAMAAWSAGLWRAANYQLQASATATYRKAVLAGQLVPRPCVVCGKSDRVHGHHEDYARPLDVIWLCPIHHSGRHHYHDDAWRTPQAEDAA